MGSLRNIGQLWQGGLQALRPGPDSCLNRCCTDVAALCQRLPHCVAANLLQFFLVFQQGCAGQAVHRLGAGPDQLAAQLLESLHRG